MTVSLSMQKIFSFMRSRSLTVELSVCANDVLFQKIFSCTNVFKAISHFLFYQVQHIWFYVEVFDPFGVEFLAEMHNYGSIYILLHADIESEQHQLLKMLFGILVGISVNYLLCFW